MKTKNAKGAISMSNGNGAGEGGVAMNMMGKRDPASLRMPNDEHMMDQHSDERGMPGIKASDRMAEGGCDCTGMPDGGMGGSGHRDTGGGGGGDDGPKVAPLRDDGVPPAAAVERPSIRAPAR